MVTKLNIFNSDLMKVFIIINLGIFTSFQAKADAVFLPKEDFCNHNAGVIFKFIKPYMAHPATPQGGGGYSAFDVETLNSFDADINGSFNFNNAFSFECMQIGLVATSPDDNTCCLPIQRN